MNDANRQRAARRRGGFTLIEALMATSILTLSVVALSETLLATYMSEQNVRRQEQAIALARDLAEQVAAKPLTAEEVPQEVPSDAAVALRQDATGLVLSVGDARIVDATLFRAPNAVNQVTTVDEVNGATDTVPAAVAGNHPAAGNYQRVVTVTRHLTPEGPVDPNGDLRRVTVTVTDPGGREHALSRIILPVTIK